MVQKISHIRKRKRKLEYFDALQSLSITDMVLGENAFYVGTNAGMVSKFSIAVQENIFQELFYGENSRYNFRTFHDNSHHTYCDRCCNLSKNLNILIMIKVPLKKIFLQIGL